MKMYADNGGGQILIGKVTRRNMQFSFIWPNFDEELNPGKWYYIKITAFLLAYGIVFVSTLMHLIITLVYKLDLHISEDIAVTASNFGISYMAALYVRTQPKIATLLKDLSRFDKFGKPPGFDKLNKKLDFWSWLASMYPTQGALTYSLNRLSKKSECEEMNKVKHLNEKCGLNYPFWIPFEIDYFPVFHLIFLCVCISTILFVRLHLSVFFQALEIAQHIILRIEHLTLMISKCFENSDYETSRKKLIKCIEYHQEIIDMSTRLDSSFTDLMFLHFVMTATICGCLEKQLVEGPYRLSAAEPFVGWIMALFIASFAGQQLVVAGESLTEAIWTSEWYQGDLRLQKDVLFFLRKSQDGLFMTVGSFGILSYPFFLSVLKMSYSILAYFTS